MKRVAFLGSKALGETVLKAMARSVPPDAWASVMLLDDRSDARTHYESLLATATSLGLPVATVVSPSDVEAALVRSPADVVVVSGWYRLLPVERSWPTTRFYGFHGSCLPAYRGNAPLVWQIINGERNAGVSFFELVAEMDEGDLVGQLSFGIDPDDSIAVVLDRAAEASAVLTHTHLPSLLDGTATLSKQPADGASYCGLRTPADGRIDWSWPATRIHDFVRAQSAPYPGAFTLLDRGERLVIWASARDPRTYHTVPGAIVERSPDGLLVGTGEGALRILAGEVETVDGWVPAETYIRSLRVRLT